MNRLWLLVAIAVSALALGIFWWAKAPPSVPSRPSALAAWNEGVALLDRYEYAMAEQRFRQVLDADASLADAWFNLGIAIMNQAKDERYPEALESYAAATRLQPSHVRARYLHAWLLDFLGRRQEAARGFEALLPEVPNDPDLLFRLSLIALDDDDIDRAESYLKRALAAETHYASAINTLQQTLARAGRAEERARALADWRRFEAAESGRKHGKIYNENGRLGQAIRQFPGPPEEAKTRGSVALSYRRVAPGGTSGDWRPDRVDVTDPSTLSAEVRRTFGTGLSAADLNDDGRPDLWVADGVTLGRLLLGTQSGWEDASSRFGLDVPSRSVSATFGDYDNDGDLDLFVCCDGPNVLLRRDGDRFVDVTVASGLDAGSGFTAMAAFADVDNDADLDLITAEAGDLRTGTTWPSNGASDRLWLATSEGRFVDGSAQFGEKTPRTTVGLLVADLDDDRDVDVLFLHADGPPRLLRNDRIERFTEVSLPPSVAALTRCDGALAMDFDKDTWPEIVLFPGPESGPLMLTVQPGLACAVDATWTEAFATSGAATGAAFDADLDGNVDLCALGRRGARIFTTQRGRVGAVVDVPDLANPGMRALLPLDIDDDGVLDLVASHGGVEPIRLIAEHAGGHALRVRLSGVREEGKTRANTGGVGALVEVVTGRDRQAQAVQTSCGVLAGPMPTLTFGVGDATEIDYVRIVWPDDVVQSEMMLPVDQPPRTIVQVQRKASSCPLLFCWTGERFTYVTDFLGTGGLGFLLGPGSYAQPDPTEWVKLPALADKDGALELRVHEPMEEILYLDEARLLVIDHAPGTEVWPDERMATDGVDPSGRLLVIATSERRFPIAFTTAHGVGDPALLTTVDRKYQPGVQPDRRFLGYAKPQEILLDLGVPLPTRDAFLFLHAWVEYPYSHVNFGAAQAGSREQPLAIAVERADGSWHVVSDNAGYPAGLPRVSTYPLGSLPNDTTGRVRIRTNLEFYIDQAFVSVDLGAEELEIRDLPSASAVLRASGYPREFSPDDALPTLYDYALMDTNIEFKSMAGHYTRFGDVTELVAAADDRYVILGRAEEVVLRFPLPEPATEGLVRSFVLKSFGYCKDMDLHTAFPHTVEPLPHRGMGTYPPTRPYPRTKEALRYLEQWNTRRIAGSR